MQWQPMATAPRDESIYIAVRPKGNDREPMIVRWWGDGWWLPEGALFQDDYFVG